MDNLRIEVACSLMIMNIVVSGILASPGPGKSNFQNVPAKVVWAVPGKDVELPCDVTPPLPTDSVNMIFWFKDTSGMPIYSLDARLNETSHLAVSNDLGTRSYFVMDQDPSRARLKIQEVAAEDEGVFRCRVDFINSPTRNFRVNLTLVVQPSVPRIFDAEGKEILTEAGPFLEGQELFLSCQVTGGKPAPSLIWWYNGTILDSVVDTGRDYFTTVNQMLITKVPRSLKGGKLECRATSYEMAGDIIREVPVIVYLKPNKVKIVSPNELLSCSKAQTVRCETSGSYPPAKIIWTLQAKPMRNAVLTEEETELFSSSIISMRLEAEDDGKELVCRADNPRFPKGYLEDKRRIHVAYPPKVAVRLDLGATSPVKEGSIVVLRCDCKARPSPHTFSWYQDGHLVPYNETAGLLPADDTLTIKSIRRRSEGEYSCSATNSEGETYSAPFNLIVQYAPRCKIGYEVNKIASVTYENMIVQCHVEAIPEVIRFHWTYNTSKGVLPMQGAKMQNTGDVSTLHFTPGTNDIESLSCWATNSVGRQETPCLFHIIPADKPESPRNCLMRNASHGGGLEVSCLAGKDGGLQQSFVLEVEDLTLPLDPSVVATLSDQGDHSTPVYRVLGETPVFRLHSLEANREYQFVVYAVNAKGRSSPPVVLPNIRLEVPTDPKQENGLSIGVYDTDKGNQPITLTLLLVILAAIVMVLIIGIVAIASVLACRRQPQVALRARRSSKPPEELELSEAGFNEGFHRRSAQYRASLYASESDFERSINSGPDLILAPVNFPRQSTDY